MDRVIAGNRDLLVRAMLAAYGKAYRFVQSDPASKEAIHSCSLAGPGRHNFDLAAAGAASQWQFVQDNKPYALDLRISPERVDYMQRQCRCRGPAQGSAVTSK